MRRRENGEPKTRSPLTRLNASDKSTDMERKNNNDSKPSLLSEIFAATSNGQKNPIRQAQAVRQLHARLSGGDFVDQMKGDNH